MFGNNKEKMLMMLKQVGIETNVIKCDEVMIKSNEDIIRIKNIDVYVLKQGNNKTYLIEGKNEIREKINNDVLNVSEDDIEFVIEHANVSKEKAIELLKRADGDVAKALLLANEKSD